MHPILLDLGPATIYTYGVLLAIEEPTNRIVMVSANSGTLLGVTAERALEHDVERAADVAGFAVGGFDGRILLPRLLCAGNVEVGDAKAGEAGFGARRRFARRQHFAARCSKASKVRHRGAGYDAYSTFARQVEHTPALQA